MPARESHVTVAMNGAVLPVTDVLFDAAPVVITAGLTVVVYAGLWFVPGIVRDLRGKGPA